MPDELEELAPPAPLELEADEAPEADVDTDEEELVLSSKSPAFSPSALSPQPPANSAGRPTPIKTNLSMHIRRIF